MADIIVEARNLRKIFRIGMREIEVLKNIDLSIKKREGLAIVGASGAGKSTLLHILGTLDQPTSGNLAYFGAEPPFGNDVALSEFRNKNIGFVFQFHHLLPEFTALENVMLPCLIAGLGQSVAEGKARELLLKVDLGERLSHRPGQLSGGEQQRVAIARALVREPAVLFADEPTGALDRSTGLKIYQLLKDLNTHYGTTLVLATHNLELAEKMDRRVTLSDGNIVNIE